MPSKIDELVHSVQSGLKAPPGQECSVFPPRLPPGYAQSTQHDVIGMMNACVNELVFDLQLGSGENLFPMILKNSIWCLK